MTYCPESCICLPAAQTHMPFILWPWAPVGGVYFWEQKHFAVPSRASRIKLDHGSLWHHTQPVQEAWQLFPSGEQQDWATGPAIHNLALLQLVLWGNEWVHIVMLWWYCVCTWKPRLVPEQQDTWHLGFLDKTRGTSGSAHNYSTSHPLPGFRS